MPRPTKYPQEDIRALILAEARKLFAEEGYERITIRRLAARLGYTPGAIYLYFKSKNELLYELHNEGFRLLHEAKLRQAGVEAADPLERLRQGGLLYIDFALEHPDYYELMFNLPEPRNFMARRDVGQKAPEGGPPAMSDDVEDDVGDDVGDDVAHAPGPVAREDYAMRSYEFLKESLELCVEAGYLRGLDLDVAAFTFWSLVHGLVSLTIRKRVPYPQPPSRELAREAVNMFMRLVEADHFASRVEEQLPRSRA